MIDPLDSAIQLLNNWGQDISLGITYPACRYSRRRKPKSRLNPNCHWHYSSLTALWLIELVSKARRLIEKFEFQATAYLASSGFLLLFLSHPFRRFQVKQTEPIQRKGWSLLVEFSELSEPFFGVTINSNKIILASFAFSFSSIWQIQIEFFSLASFEKHWESDKRFLKLRRRPAVTSRFQSFHGVDLPRSWDWANWPQVPQLRIRQLSIFSFIASTF